MSYLASNFASQWITFLFRNRAGFVLAASYFDCGFLWFSLVLPRSQYSDSLWAGLSGIEPRWCESVHTRPVRPWGPPFHQYSWQRVSCPAVKRPECGVEHTTHLAPVKCSRYRPGVAQKVGRGIALLFHDCGTRRGWVVSSTPRPHFTPGKDPVTILQEAGWAPGPVWTGGKSRPHRDSIPDRPDRSQSLYRLSYPAHRPNKL